jgi:hypothetical protein
MVTEIHKIIHITAKFKNRKKKSYLIQNWIKNYKKMRYRHLKVMKALK